MVTAPIETSVTSGLPSELGIAIASGFVPASGSPPSGWESRAGMSPSARHETSFGQPPVYQPRAPVGKQFEATTTRACSGDSASCASQIAVSVRSPSAPAPSQRS